MYGERLQKSLHSRVKKLNSRCGWGKLAGGGLKLVGGGGSAVGELGECSSGENSNFNDTSTLRKRRMFKWIREKPLSEQNSTKKNDKNIKKIDKAP